jgi:hypothetical protein
MLKRSGWNSAQKTARWALVAAFAVTPFIAAAQTGNAQEGSEGLVVQPRGQVATAAVDHAVTLEALPQVSATNTANGPKLIWGHQASQSAYLAAKTRAASGQFAGAPAAEAMSPPVQAPAPESTSGVETPGATVGFVGNIETTCGGFTPADMGLAVGDDTPSHPVLQANNSCISIFTKGGAIASGYPKSLRSFLGSGNLFLSDPRLLYDPANRRYILVELAIDTVNNKGYEYVAVSQGDDPGGAYFIYVIPTDTANAFGDFPRVGQDHQAIYLASNIFSPIASCLAGQSSCKYLYEQWDFLPKAQMYAGAGFSYWTIGAIGGVDTTQPANIWNPTDIPRAEFLVASKNFAAGNSGCFAGAVNGLLVWAISNPLVTNASVPPEFSEVAVATANNYIIPQSAKQPNTSALIDTGDCRISGEVTYANGSLYAALATGTSAGYPGVIMYQIQPFLGKDNNTRCTGSFTNLCPDITSATIRNEIFLLYGGGLAAYYPTQQPDPEGNVTTVLNVSGNGSFPAFGSTVYVSRRVTQPPGTLLDGGFFLAGGATTYAQGRWGDYTAVSPNFGAGPNAVWFSGMFTGSDHNWGTAVGKAGFTAINQP